MGPFVEINLAVEKKPNRREYTKTNDPVHMGLPMLVLPVNDLAVFDMHDLVAIPALHKHAISIHCP